jgi:hypothetical protein
MLLSRSPRPPPVPRCHIVAVSAQTELDGIAGRSAVRRWCNVGSGWQCSTREAVQFSFSHVLPHPCQPWKTRRWWPPARPAGLQAAGEAGGERRALSAARPAECSHQRAGGAGRRALGAEGRRGWGAAGEGGWRGGGSRFMARPCAGRGAPVMSTEAALRLWALKKMGLRGRGQAAA